MIETLMVIALLGQVGEVETQPETTTAAPAEEPAPQPPSDEAAVEAPPMTAEERLMVLEGKIAALEEQASTAGADLSILKSIKLSGYIQARWQLSESSAHGLDAAGSPRVKDGFSVRRGRLKATATGDWYQLVLQIDATGKAVTLKDAEAHLIEPWTGLDMHFIMGQQKWPFSYEVIQSSSDREFPERTRVVRAFAPGERDRGAKITGKWGPLFWGAGVFDGNGTDNKKFIGVDNDMYKDGVARVGVDFDWISVAGYGWYGRTRKPADTSDPANPIGPEDFHRWRAGGDAQLYLDLIPFGGTALKGEFIAGETWTKDGVEQFGKQGMGGYVLLTQNLWQWGAIGVRYDRFDGNINEVDDAVDTIGVAFLGYFGEMLKATLCYEIILSEVDPDPQDNILTVQLQAKL